MRRTRDGRSAPLDQIVEIQMRHKEKIQMQGSLWTALQVWLSFQVVGYKGGLGSIHTELLWLGYTAETDTER